MAMRGRTTHLRRSRRRSPAGFTLVELMAVIVIIGTMITMLLPSLRRSMREASATVCLHNLKEIGRGLHEYRMDNTGRLPDVSTYSETEQDEPQGAAWYGRLVPRYLGSRNALICPVDPARPTLLSGETIERHRDPANLSSYGMNSLIRAADLWNLDRDGPTVPQETILLADAGPDLVRGGRVDRNDGWLPWDDGYHPATAGLRDSWLTGRHFGHINVLTMGGNVQRVRTEDLLVDRIRAYYGDCAAGGCPLCNTYALAHYSFAPSRLFWWTGAIHSANP